MDLSSLLTTLPAVRSQSMIHDAQQVSLLHYPHYCQNCSFRYEPRWFHRPQERCFFCMRFRSANITRYALLYETQWYFIQSGEQDAPTFYDTYFYYLHRWADRFNIPITHREARYQMELLRSLETDSV